MFVCRIGWGYVCVQMYFKIIQDFSTTVTSHLNPYKCFPWKNKSIYTWGMQRQGGIANQFCQIMKGVALLSGTTICKWHSPSCQLHRVKHHLLFLGEFQADQLCILRVREASVPEAGSPSTHCSPDPPTSSIKECTLVSLSLSKELMFIHYST